MPQPKTRLERFRWPEGGQVVASSPTNESVPAPLLDVPAARLVAMSRSSLSEG